MILDRETAQEMAWISPGDAIEGLVKLSSEVTGRGRWTIYHRTIFRDADGKLWGFKWDEGATERQEVDWPEQVECLPMREVQVTVTKYEVIK